jgi:hypothetical protein
MNNITSQSLGLLTSSFFAGAMAFSRYHTSAMKLTFLCPSRCSMGHSFLPPHHTPFAHPAFWMRRARLVRDDGIHANESLALSLVPSADPPRWWRAHPRRECAFCLPMSLRLLPFPAKSLYMVQRGKRRNDEMRALLTDTQAADEIKVFHIPRSQNPKVQK